MSVFSKKATTHFFYGMVLFLALSQAMTGQTLPTGSPIVENYLRRQQLLGNFDSTYSFHIRPIHIGENGLKIDKEVFDTQAYFRTVFTSKNEAFKLMALPAEMRVAYDLRHPNSRNDGAMIRAKGLQTYVSAGFFAEFGPLTLQFKPEFVWAENLSYQGFPTFPRHRIDTWRTRYLYYNLADLPERYGDAIYTQFHWGQSSLRLNKWGLSLGLSTENIYWGPSKRNSIMLSSNAAGFPHLTLNTQRPIMSPIGTFEWQMLSGRLEGSGHLPPESNTDFNGRSYSPRDDDWRYFQGASISYSPKWINGLSLGVTRWVQQYYQLAKETNDFFPIFSNLFRDNDNNRTRNEVARDQAAGVFARWVWFDTNSEFYFEFAKNDASANFRDLLIDPDHSRAFTLGVDKIFNKGGENGHWQFNFEWTQMSQTESRLARNSRSWYIHGTVRHGFTNNGEVMGSALGPGGNGQYMEVSWINGLRRIGGAFERHVHNEDFRTEAFRDDFNRSWIDFNVYGFVEWQFDNLMLTGSLFFTKSHNYQWEAKFDPVNANPFPNFPGVDRTNWNLDIKASYSF